MKNMKKSLLGIALAIACAFSAWANENPIYTVKVNDLEYAVPEKKTTAGDVIGTVFETLAGNATNNKHPELAPGISSNVKAAISGVRRLATVTDNPQFEITGEITNISTTTSARTVERKDSKGKPYKVVVNDYQASIGITLTLTELASGQQWAHAFSAENGWFESAMSEGDAIASATRHLQDDIIKCYNNMFPLVANIIERGKEKKDKQQEAYIDLGDANGVYKGLHFTVFELGQVAGKETRKKLGKLKIEEVMGDDVSRCKIEKGHKEIKSALDEGKTLLVVTID